MSMKLLFQLFLCVGVLASSGLADEEKTEPPKPTSRTERRIQGWRVRVDDRLLAPANEALGRRALLMLEAQLADIKDVLASDRLEKVQAVPIVIDLTHGELRSMQYHPNPQWLEDHGYARDLAKCVHIPNTTYFTSRRVHRDQPWAVMHELAHAYSDQVLGSDKAEIGAAWKKYCDSGHGKSVLRIEGRRMPHYALTNQAEFFAEMTEAYLGRNDYYPFNHAELAEAEPEIYALMKTIWGPLNLK